MATIPMSSKSVRGEKGEGAGLTEDDDQGNHVNPIFLDETLLWFRRDDLAFGRKRWR